ncbi:MAG: type II toxin-antitoxin system VapC family toxin [Bifidobacteriaceae bacterium]|jgi:predicted nucleic acid-binding protein|nr:type II toxin-antitoxin system VapC family toxin [Bifidobacteriaceae bacterium]
MIAVLDASAAVDMLVRGPRTDRVRQTVAGLELCAPQLVDLEVASALARLERAGTIDAAAAEKAIKAWSDAPVRRTDPPGLARRAFASRANLRVADAFYAALAIQLAVPLVTTDSRLAAAPAPGLTVTLIN